MKSLQINLRDCKLALAYLLFAFAALLIGGIAGLVQVFVRSGALELPYSIGYYQVLTIHGVLLALVFTTFFIFGFQTAAMSRVTGIFSFKERCLGWIGFGVMSTGTVMAATMVLLNEASVLYTFYAPLQAHWVFYAGLSLVMIGSWIAAFAQAHRYIQWKKKIQNSLHRYSALWSYVII